MLYQNDGDINANDVSIDLGQNTDNNNIIKKFIEVPITRNRLMSTTSSMNDITEQLLDKNVKLSKENLQRFKKSMKHEIEKAINFYDTRLMRNINKLYYWTIK